MQAFKNICSYVWYVLGQSRYLLFCTVIDLSILVWSVFNYDKIFGESTLFLIVLAILINIVWQGLNIANHFSFLKREKRGCPLQTIGQKDFKQIIKVNPDLFYGTYKYSFNEELGVLENSEISKILEQNKIPISLNLVKDKQQKTKKYINQYRNTLLKFLNHKWYDINQNGGKFTNDKKICFLSELYEDNGKLYWKVTKGCYYNGYLTNVIFSKFIGGSEYSLYPPFNSTNTVISRLGDSIFSDHIGVSTILLTEDRFLIYCLQTGNAAQNANKYMPSGSGSLDYNDFHENEDLHSLIVRGAERELFEETSLGQLLKKEKNQEPDIKIETTILSFYRDLERAGKPEFCCVSRINKNLEFIKHIFKPENKELASIKWAMYSTDMEDWEKNTLSSASLSLKMNYKALHDYLVSVNHL